MSNYLTNLAALSLRVVPTVQPRLYPRFEPAPQAGVLNAVRPFGPLADESGLDATIMEDGGHSPHETPRAPVNPQGRLTAPVASGEDGFSTSLPHPKSPTPASDLSTRNITGAVLMTDVFTPSQLRRPLLDHALNDASIIKAAAAPSRVTGRSNDEETAPLPHDERLRTNLQGQFASKDIARQKALLEERIMPAARVEPVATARPSTPPLLPIIAQPRIRPVSTEQSHEGHGRGTKAGEPVASTIQVTIGRIEIRAEQTTASAAAKPRGAQPVMSLDEYLRSRGSGGGR